MSITGQARVVPTILLLGGSALAQGQTIHVSRNSAGEGGNRISHIPSISGDYQRIAFSSGASDLVPGDVGSHWDVFVFDRSTATTRRVSQLADGTGGNGPSFRPMISADGRWVAYDTLAANLGGNFSFSVVVLHELATGLNTRISPASGSGPPAESPRISADGRFVAYTRLQPRAEAWLYDHATGTSTLASTSVQFNGQAWARDVSADGRYVLFTSSCDDHVAGDTNGVEDVFVRDMTLGVTLRVSLSPAGAQADRRSTFACMSSDGRYIAFHSEATNLLPGFPGWPPLNYEQPNVYLHDRAQGSLVAVSRTPQGVQGDSPSTLDSISADGRWVGFTTSASDLVSGDTNSAPDAYLFDRDSSLVRRVGLWTHGAQLPASNSPQVGHPEGLVAVFNSLGPQTWGFPQVLLHDMRVGFITSYCSGGATCPCGNNGAPGSGCENSLGTGGARLTGSGSASVSGDTVALVVGSAPATTTVLFFQGTAWVNASDGSPFGDGLRCVAGAVVRLAAKPASGGSATYGPAAGDVPVSVRGAVPASSIRYYQAWYRNVDPGYCTPALFNLSNGLEIRWGA